MKVFAGVLLGVVVGVYCLAFLFWTKTEVVTVVSHEWYGDRIIEDYQTRSGDDWDNSVPNDAFDITCHSKLYSTVMVDKTPISTYKDWCDYHINRWQYIMTLRNEGDQLSTPSIPEPSLPCNGIQEIGCQRYAGEHVTYQITFARGLGVVVCDYDQPTWDSLQNGQSYPMVFGVVRNEPRCKLINNS